jgi:hypothetical protein
MNWQKESHTTASAFAVVHMALSEIDTAVD